MNDEKHGQGNAFDELINAYFLFERRWMQSWKTLSVWYAHKAYLMQKWSKADSFLICSTFLAMFHNYVAELCVSQSIDFATIRNNQKKEGMPVCSHPSWNFIFHLAIRYGNNSEIFKFWHYLNVILSASSI